MSIGIWQGVALFVGLTLFTLPDNIPKILQHFRPVDLFRDIPKVSISGVVSFVVDFSNHQFPKYFSIDSVSLQYVGHSSPPLVVAYSRP